jgi:hypothetical protein
LELEQPQVHMADNIVEQVSLLRKEKKDTQKNDHKGKPPERPPSSGSKIHLTSIRRYLSLFAAKNYTTLPSRGQSVPVDLHVLTVLS